MAEARQKLLGELGPPVLDNYQVAPIRLIADRADHEQARPIRGDVKIRHHCALFEEFLGLTELETAVTPTRKSIALIIAANQHGSGT